MPFLTEIVAVVCFPAGCIPVLFGFFKAARIFQKSIQVNIQQENGGKAILHIFSDAQIDSFLEIAANILIQFHMFFGEGIFRPYFIRGGRKQTDTVGTNFSTGTHGHLVIAALLYHLSEIVIRIIECFTDARLVRIVTEEYVFSLNLYAVLLTAQRVSNKACILIGMVACDLISSFVQSTGNFQVQLFIANHTAELQILVHFLGIFRHFIRRIGRKMPYKI